MYMKAVALRWAGKQTHVIPTLGRRRWCSTYIEFRRHLMFLAHGKMEYHLRGRCHPVFQWFFWVESSMSSPSHGQHIKPFRVFALSTFKKSCTPLMNSGERRSALYIQCQFICITWRTPYKKLVITHVIQHAWLVVN